MNNDKEGYIPPEYGSLLYLHTMLGDIETVKCICCIWNKLNQGDTLRVQGDDGFGTIIITGICCNLASALSICRQLTTFGVAVKYEKTIVKVEFEL